MPTLLLSVFTFVLYCNYVILQSFLFSISALTSITNSVSTYLFLSLYITSAWSFNLSISLFNTYINIEAYTTALSTYNFSHYILTVCVPIVFLFLFLSQHLLTSMLKIPHLCSLLMGEEPPSTGVGQNEESEAVSGNAKLAEYAMDSALRSYQYCSPGNSSGYLSQAWSSRKTRMKPKESWQQKIQSQSI